MADKEKDGPPPLECQETAELRANSTINYSVGEADKVLETSNSDRDTKNPSIPLDIDDESRSYVGHVTDHQDPESPVTTRSNSPEPMSASGTDDSDYYADTIIDSPRSTDTTVDVNDIDFGPENEPHIIHNLDETCLLYQPCCCSRHFPNPSEDSDEI